MTGWTHFSLWVKMEGKILPLCLTAILLCIVQVSGYFNTYRGAVVEYNGDFSGSEEEVVAKNVENYIKFIIQAKAKKAEIIVFPEMGLRARTIASPIPDPVDDVTPCDNPEFETTQAVRDISCAAKNNKIYTVINLVEKRKCDDDDKDCPEEGFYRYNTNVVFDRKGAVIARYAKFNLYDEADINRPKEPEMVFFDTDFGVRFGTFICFDILFQTPPLRLVHQYGITDFVYTTYWFSELPFLTALQVQSGWAETNNVNLLASGANKVRTGTTGSGIYNGKYGALVQIFSNVTTSKLLIADVPRIDNTPSNDVINTNATHVIIPKPLPNVIIPEPIFSDELRLRQDDVYRFRSEVIEPWKPFHKRICRGMRFCCYFNVSIDTLRHEETEYTYRAVVLDGVREFSDDFRGGVQGCGVVLCNGPNLQNCTTQMEASDMFYINEMKIRGNFKLRNALQIPTTLTDGDRFEPLPTNRYEFKRTEMNGKAEVVMELLWPGTNLRTFGIYGRVFSEDNQVFHAVAGGSLTTSVPYLLVALVAFVTHGR